MGRAETATDIRFMVHKWQSQMLLLHTSFDLRTAVRILCSYPDTCLPVICFKVFFSNAREFVRDLRMETRGETREPRKIEPRIPPDGCTALSNVTPDGGRTAGK